MKVDNLDLNVANAHAWHARVEYVDRFLHDEPIFFFRGIYPIRTWLPLTPSTVTLTWSPNH